MFDYIIVGKGLIGSAAARYLSQISDKVAIIGPDEPEVWETHPGVFASHYDQGRITRILDQDWVWGLLAKRSIAQYSHIEQQSGIKFHHPVDGLTVEPATTPADSYLRKSIAVGTQLGAKFEQYDSTVLTEAAPMFGFPPGMMGVREAAPAGYINPRSLIAAQLIIAEQQGTTVIKETITAIDSGANGGTVTSTTGRTYQANKILIATGAYTNTLLPQKLALTCKARTIVMAELPQAEVHAYKRCPP